MIQWKQRLYAFLLRRVLGPFLDAAAAQKLHDSLDVSLQEGVFVLKDVVLDSVYLTERLTDKVPGLRVRKATINRLQIQLTLQENQSPQATSGSTTGASNSVPETTTTTSSLAWRAMKIGTMNESLPAVSLIADVIIDGIYLEMEPIDRERRKATSKPPTEHSKTRNTTPTTTKTSAEEISSKSVIGSYVDAALASLKMNLKLTDVTVKLCQSNKNEAGVLKEQWLTLKLSVFSYKSLDVHNPTSNTSTTNDNQQATYKMTVHKLVEISEITVISGETICRENQADLGGPSRPTSSTSTIAMAQGNGQIFYRVIEYHDNSSIAKTDAHQQLQQDVEVKLNHQLNLSVDQVSLLRLQSLAQGFGDISEGSNNNSQGGTIGDTAAENAVRNHPHILDSTDGDPDTDRDDLKALTGIMRQYREAYHLAERNQLRGGILVPSNAYLEDVNQLEEDQEDSATFDVFFDANDQSFYNATSVLAKSMRQSPEDSEDDDEGDVSDHVDTKLRFHLLSGCLKIVFWQPGEKLHHPSRPQEYMLLTVEDISVSLASSRRTSEMNLNVLHFDIEDAQFTTTRGSSQGNGSLEIGKVLGFLPDCSSTDDYGEEMILSQAPCISFHSKTTRDTTSRNITLLGLEVCFRHRTVSNLSNMKVFLQDSATETEKSASSESAISPKETKKQRKIEIICTCPSIALLIPLLKRVSTGSMFLRSGEVIQNADVTDSSIGVSFESTSFELKSQSDRRLESGQSSISGGFSCHQIFVFAMCPEGGSVAFGSRMLRKDVLAASGRVEVNPFIPISFNFARIIPDGVDANPGRDSFPIVPAISSFKARQEDDDDDVVASDRVGSSKTGQAEFDSRKDLRGSDPQISMLSDAEKSNVIVTILVPEILFEVSGKELTTFVQMVNATKPPIDSAVAPARSQPGPVSMTSFDVKSVAIACEYITLAVCEDDKNGGSNQTSEGLFQCVLAMDKARCHVLLFGSKLRHIRVMCHDPCMYAIVRRHQRPSTSGRMSSAKSRVQMLKDMIRNHSQKPGVPLMFRSRMFTPISDETPSILIDVVHTSVAPDQENDEKQKRVYLTLYHLTYRYDVESTWISSLLGLLSSLRQKAEDDVGSVQVPLSNTTEYHDQPSMTRLFVSCADLNLDYTSPLCFERASRAVVRIGDFRVSSNIVAPIGPLQAYSISLGDLNCHISNSRIPHISEDSRLCRSTWLFGLMSSDLTAQKSSIFGAMPEAILRELGFVNVVSLDMMEAFVTKRQDACLGATSRSATPQLSTTLTIGTLAVQACKDSFTCFSETTGELQAKLTSLTDDDIRALKKLSNHAVDKDARPSKAPRKNYVREATIRNQILIPEVEFSAKERESQGNFLLDGYEWTTVDHDPLKELEISPGDEQRAGWYTTEDSIAGSMPVDIIQQHFPLYAIADPLSEGDMHVKRFAGKSANICVKSRMLIHKLNIRIRFFDGYDWPDSCNSRQREAAMRPRKMFVIEPEPASVVREKEKELPQEFESKSRLTRKAQLMGELLDTDEKESSTFLEAPLPQEKAMTIDREKHLRLNCRQSNVFFQISLNGVTLRMDSFGKSATHRLQSLVELAISNFFVAETVSTSKPLKMFGEWANDEVHPRDTRFGTVMMSMATWSPIARITENNDVSSDECEMSIQLLPMRLLLDQRAIAFIKAFVNNEDSEEKDAGIRKKWSDGLHVIPPPVFKVFKIKPWKVKVDYNPTRMDVAALREGSIVELVNITPIHRMVITLSEVSVVDSLGLGPVFSEVVSSWVNEICGTQLHKFLANARPFEPFTDVGQGLTDLVVLPYEAFRQGDSIQRAMRKGMKSLAETVIFQALTTTSGLTKYAADLMADVLGGGRPNDVSHPLPARPSAVPKGIQDIRRHACESLARGIQTANYKIVVVPYKQYTRSGVTGAVTSVIRGIPVLLVAPLTGATEAASYTLLGARNALRPDIRKEEEASMSLH